MSDPVSVASAAIALLSERIKAQEKILSYHDRNDELNRVELDVELSRQKFQSWQETWSSEAGNPHVKTPQSEATSKALWGVQGWANVLRMLENVNRASKKLEASLLEIQDSSKTPPRTRWKAAVHALRHKGQRPRPKHQNVKLLAAALNKSIDELWLYTETVFDSLHGVMAQEERYPSREKLLASALQSRAGTLDLYHLCAISPKDWSLELDLLDAGPMSFHSWHQSVKSPLRPFYHLFSQTLDTPKIVHEVIVENTPEDRSSIEQNDEVIQSEQFEVSRLNPSLYLFCQLLSQKHSLSTELHKLNTGKTPKGGSPIELKGEIMQPNHTESQNSRPHIYISMSGTSTVIIPVVDKGSGTPSCLRIPESSIADRHLRSSPETLPDVLDTLKKATRNLSVSEHFSVGARVELAYKIVECGFFLLGTPWFSSLRSRNVLRLKINGKKHYSYMLRVQTLDMDDLLFDDSEALTETSQLYRIGVLLMEIALDGPDPGIPIEECGDDRSRTSLLPLIEQTMGVQYCKATAFCLQKRPQQARFQGLSKYKTSHFQDWKSYLAAFLQDYHSQVFLRLEELREIDTRSEYRSRKSWQTN